MTMASEQKKQQTNGWTTWKTEYQIGQKHKAWSNAADQICVAIARPMGNQNSKHVVWTNQNTEKRTATVYPTRPIRDQKIARIAT
jgi:hypothetical protein